MRVAELARPLSGGALDIMGRTSKDKGPGTSSLLGAGRFLLEGVRISMFSGQFASLKLSSVKASQIQNGTRDWYTEVFLFSV